MFLNAVKQNQYYLNFSKNKFYEKDETVVFIELKRKFFVILALIFKYLLNAFRLKDWKFSLRKLNKKTKLKAKL